MVMVMHLALPTGALLKGIPPNLSAEMLFALAKMGHGDEIVFGDANFPARCYFVQRLIPTYYYCVNHYFRSVCDSWFKCSFIDATGHDIPSLLESVLTLG